MLFFLYRNVRSKNQQSKFRFSFKLFPDYDWLLVATIFGGKVFFLLPFSCDTEFNIINMMHSNNSNLHTDILNFVYLQWSLPLYFMGLHWVFDFSNAVVILANARRKEKKFKYLMSRDGWAFIDSYVAPALNVVGALYSFTFPSIQWYLFQKTS